MFKLMPALPSWRKTVFFAYSKVTSCSVLHSTYIRHATSEAGWGGVITSWYPKVMFYCTPYTCVMVRPGWGGVITSWYSNVVFYCIPQTCVMVRLGWGGVITFWFSNIMHVLLHSTYMRHGTSGVGCGNNVLQGTPKSCAIALHIHASWYVWGGLR